MFKLFNPKVLSVATRFVKSALFSSQVEVYDILTSRLRYNGETVEHIFRLHGELITKIPKKQLIENCDILQKFSVNMQEPQYLVYCLKLKPYLIRTRIMLLEEMGLENVSLIDISRFAPLMHMTVKRFKRDHNIPQEQSIIQNLFKSVGLFRLGHRREKPCTRVSMCYKECLTYYAKYCLKLSDRDFSSRLVKFRSFRELTNTLRILQNELQLNNNVLNKYRSLIYMYPECLINFLTELKDVQIDGKSIKEVITRNPSILYADVQNLKELLTLFKKLNIREQSIAYNTFFILRMKKEVFLERYRHIVSTPELCTWTQHPRILHLTMMYHTTMSRIEYLRLRRLTNRVNIHTVMSAQRFFKRYIQGNTKRLNQRKFLWYILCKELGPDKINVLHSTARHPYWARVSLISLEERIQFLKKRYSAEDICRNIEIVFYPLEAVAEMLEKVCREYTTEKGYNFTPSQYLALCVYMLEKNNHFSGDAIWGLMHDGNDPNQTLKDLDDSEEMQNFDQSLDLNANVTCNFDEIQWHEPTY